MNEGKVVDFNPNQFKKLSIFTDGGARGNPGPAACACVIKGNAGNVRLMCGKYLGKTTNNTAEYQGVILAYEEIEKFPKLNFSEMDLSFSLDSNLVVNQLNGKFKVKNENIRTLVVKIREYEAKFRTINYKFIPREKNELADSVVNKTLDEQLAQS